MKDNEQQYIIWQNRAYCYYIAARLLNMKKVYGPAAFCGHQALEIILKATLIYWDKSFSPIVAGHKMTKMINAIKNKVPNGKTIDIPEYFFSDQRYLSVSRYPARGKGVGIPGTFINDLDDAFVKLVTLVPVQFNSKLLHTLQGDDRANLNILRKANKSIRLLRRHIRPFIRRTA
jgi:HEPN domain-containing protein